MHEKLPYPGPEGQRYAIVRLKDRQSICELIEDYDGREYYVTIRRWTPYRWDLLFGLPLDKPYGARRSEVIVTPQLRDLLLSVEGVVDLCLPLSQVTAEKLRRQLSGAKK